MKPRAPHSLTAQLILLLVLAVMAAQVPVWLVFASQSTPVGRVAFTTRIGERVATIVKVIDVVPPELVPRVIAAYSIPVSRFTLDERSGVRDGGMDADDLEIAQLLAHRLRYDLDRVRILLDDEGEPIVRYVPWHATGKTILVSVRLASGQWLNTRTKINLPDTPLWLQVGLVQLGGALVAILFALGLGLRHLIAPVSALADAAEQAGRGGAVAPLPERGPRELRTMTASFNAMQARLRAFVDDRTRMIGAISHDLRTPLSSLWLRAELVDDAELREEMVRTLAEMRHMVDATLAFAREDAMGDSGPVDLAQLARSVADDRHTLGQDVSVRSPVSVPSFGRAVALRRALDNLVGNAVRYGERARLVLAVEPDVIRIRIDDDGPGLPPERVEDMFQPFVRLDDSRSTQTGGTGLGLAIARSAVREHGGELTLVNRSGGGLRAEIILPLRPPVLGDGSPAPVRPDQIPRRVLLP